jgi:hypothetical protein
MARQRCKEVSTKKGLYAPRDTSLSDHPNLAMSFSFDGFSVANLRFSRNEDGARGM